MVSAVGLDVPPATVVDCYVRSCHIRFTLNLFIDKFYFESVHWFVYWHFDHGWVWRIVESDHR